MSETPTILFVCVQNAGRSQMAEALMTARLKGRAQVFSAGTKPAKEIDPVVIEVMKENGIDLSDRRPKALTEEMVRGADIVVTMGCGDACPVFPDKTYVDWNLSDPAARPVLEVRAIRDEIALRVGLLADSLQRSG
ncbi:MAG: low molecular weight phosphatase family protein [Actinomycetota bacterium]|nr:arsenate reductase ArsC [Actinomycetota bacterium]